MLFERTVQDAYKKSPQLRVIEGLKCELRIRPRIERKQESHGIVVHDATSFDRSAFAFTRQIGCRTRIQGAICVTWT
jgi:hypothetical protein